MENTTIGQRITKLRKDSGLTQTELAEKLFISNKSVSKWESDVGIPSLEMLQALSDLFNCSLDYLINNKDVENKKDDSITIDLGTDLNGNVIKRKLSEIRNCLITGHVGTGKSNFIHNVITQIATKYTPDEVKLVLVDEKRVELLNTYNKLPHLYTPIIENVEGFTELFDNLESEIIQRMDTITQNQCIDIAEYNLKNKTKKLPYILVIVDEIKFCGEKVFFDEYPRNLIKICEMSGIYLYFASYNFDEIFLNKYKDIFSTQIAFEDKNQLSNNILNLTVPFINNTINRPGTSLFISASSSQIITMHNDLFSNERIDQELSKLNKN